MQIIKLQDEQLKKKLKNFVFDIIGCCQDVHKEKGPALTEYIYQECLEIALTQKNIPYEREFSFSPTFRGVPLKSTLRVDFFVKEKIFLECKAIDRIGFPERLQLTSYMRNAGIRIGILYNFSPVLAQCEKFYLDTENNIMYFF